MTDKTAMNSYPRLVADIGGTNARFAIESKPFKLSHIIILACKDYDTFLDAIYDYLRQITIKKPRHIGIAIANPVNSDSISMTNHHWHFSISETKKDLGVDTFIVINDFRAQALALTQMDKDCFLLLNGPKQKEPVPKNDPIAVIGPGTGLGVSGLIPDKKGELLALSGEGGHTSFAPYNKLERQLLSFAKCVYNEHISNERILQGDGLMLIYHFMTGRYAIQAKKNNPAAITYGALIEKDALCIKALSLYCAVLGGFCADIALTIGAVGGVYLSGGMVPRFTSFLQQSAFRDRFEDKGRFASYLYNIPVYIVTHKNPGLLGSAVALNNKLI